MANDSKRISQLGVTSTLSRNDRVLVLTSSQSSPNAETISVNNFVTVLGNTLSTFSTNIIPATDSTYTLGNSSHQWKSLYVSANTIYVGGTPLTISDGTLVVNSLPVIANTGNVVFTQYNAPWNQTYPVITTKVQYDLNIVGNNAPVNISSDQYAQLVYSEDGSPYGGGNNQSYYWTSSYYNGQYIQSVNSAANTSAWTEKDYWANGTVDTYGIFSNNDYNFNYSYSFNPSYRIYGRGLDIKPFGGFNNTLTLEPTADYDIHLYESYTNGAITLGKYGQSNLRVYGPGGANGGGGQYGNDIRADVVGNSVFYITTSSGSHTWSFNPDGSITGDIVPPTDNTYSLGNTTNQWKALHVSGNTIFIDRVPLSSSNGSIAANTIKVNTLYDELRRPVYNVNALDINADGGISAAVYSPSDPVFDGGSTITVYNQFEASLDGGASFNNRHSVSYIDGGGANII